jgi:Ca2+-binding EF-hand superfamily protein
LSFIDLKLLFALFDVDNSGTLTNEELKQLLQSSDPAGPPISEQQVAEYLKLADTDSKEYLFYSSSIINY